MSVEDKLIENGYEGSVYLTNPDYEDEACEWIDYNVIRGLPYMGENHPIVVYPLIE